MDIQEQGPSAPWSMITGKCSSQSSIQPSFTLTSICKLSNKSYPILLTSNQSTPEPSDWKCCHCHLSYILNCNTTQVMTKQCCCCFFVFFSQACTCRNLPSKSERWCNPYHACSRDLLCWLFCLRAEWDKQEVRRLWNSHTCIHASQCFRAKCIPCRLLSKAHYVVAISQYVIAAVIPRFVVYSNITAFLT